MRVVRLITVGLLLVLGAWCALLSGGRAVTAHLNSDLLYPFELYRDFFIDRVPLSRLSWTPAGFLFPDLLVLGVLRALLGEAGRALHAYSVFAWLSLVAAGYAVCRAGAARLPSLETALAAGALWLAALAGADRTTLVTLLPIYHHGSLVNGLSCLALLLAAARAGWTRSREWTFFLLLVVASLSDLVFITQLLLPSLLGLWWAARRGAVPLPVVRRAWSWTVAAGVTHLAVLRLLTATTGISFRGNPIALGVAAGAVVSQPVLVVPSSWPLANARAFARALGELATRDPQLWIWLPAALLAAGMMLRRARPGAASIVSLAFLAGTAVLLVEGCLTWIGHGKQVFMHPQVFDEGTLRHLQPLYVLPPFVLGALALWRRGQGPPLWLLLGVLLALSSQAALAPPLASLRLTPPDEVRCLDGAGLHAGYADYWVARHLSLLSQSGLRLSPVELHHLGTEHWENNPARYLSPAEPYLKHDFVIVGRWRRDRLLARWGQPARRVSCGDWEALVYDRPDDFAFRHLLHLPALADNQLPMPPGWGRFANDGEAVVAAPVEGFALDRPGTGDLVEIALPGGESSELTLLDAGGRELERLRVRAAQGGGLRRRWLRRAGGAPIARVRLTPAVSVAYLFVYSD